MSEHELDVATVAAAKYRFPKLMIHCNIFILFNLALFTRINQDMQPNADRNESRKIVEVSEGSWFELLIFVERNIFSLKGNETEEFWDALGGQNAFCT